MTCEQCDKETRHLIEKPNHVAHVILTILTGVWLLMWMAAFAQKHTAKCLECGTTHKVGVGQSTRVMVFVMIVLFVLAYGLVLFALGNISAVLG